MRRDFARNKTCRIKHRRRTWKNARGFPLEAQLPKESAHIGEPAGIHDFNGEEIRYGDLVVLMFREIVTPPNPEDLRLPINDFYDKFRGKAYRGRVFSENRVLRLYLDYSVWYQNLNPYNPGSYGKAVFLSQDDGMRMTLLRVPEN